MPKKPIKPKSDKPESNQNWQKDANDWLDDSLAFFESEDMPEGLHDQFMDYIKAFEQAQWFTAFDVLAQGGIVLPNPDDLDDGQLPAKLWEVIRAMAMLRIFLYNTNHLSDRELYGALWHEVLREEGPLLPANSDSACHIDLVDSGSEEDMELYLRYYADEQDRLDWAEDWPDDTLPASETPPFDRDRLLPAHHQTEWQHSGQSS